MAMQQAIRTSLPKFSNTPTTRKFSIIDQIFNRFSLIFGSSWSMRFHDANPEVTQGLLSLGKREWQTLLEFKQTTQDEIDLAIEKLKLELELLARYAVDVTKRTMSDEITRTAGSNCDS